MTDFTKERAAAAAKMAFGVARMGGAVVTGTGHGVLGAALKQRHMAHAAVHLGKLGFMGGKRMFEEGLADWKRLR